MFTISAIYHDDPDMVNHHFGVKSIISKELIQKLDNVLLNLQLKVGREYTNYNNTNNVQMLMVQCIMGGIGCQTLVAHG